MSLIVRIGQFHSLLIAIIVGATSYFLIIYFMKIEEIDTIVKMIKTKITRE